MEVPHDPYVRSDLIVCFSFVFPGESIVGSFWERKDYYKQQLQQVWEISATQVQQWQRYRDRGKGRWYALQNNRRVPPRSYQNGGGAKHSCGLKDCFVVWVSPYQRKLSFSLELEGEGEGREILDYYPAIATVTARVFTTYANSSNGMSHYL